MITIEKNKLPQPFKKTRYVLFDKMRRNPHLYTQSSANQNYVLHKKKRQKKK